MTDKEVYIGKILPESEQKIFEYSNNPSNWGDVHTQSWDETGKSVIMTEKGEIKYVQNIIDANVLLLWLYNKHERFVEPSMYQSVIFCEIRKKITDKIFELSNVGIWNEDMVNAPRNRRIMLVKSLNNEIVIQKLESLTNGAIQDQFVKWAELPDVN